MNINWSYYFDEFKDRIFLLFGFLFIFTLTSVTDWPILGNDMLEAQELGMIPNNGQIALYLKLATVIVIFSVSWDVLAGYSGQISFGHALFLGMGAYVSAFVKLGYPPTTKTNHNGFDDDIHDLFGIPVNISMLYSIFIAAFIVAIFALVLGTLTLRLKGPYFALVTLVLPLIAQILVTNIWVDQTGGESGISMAKGRLVGEVEQDPELSFVDRLAVQGEAEFYVYFFIMIFCVGMMYLLARSRYGLVLKSIREDELAAASSGINVDFYKVSAYAISAFFAAVAGGLLGQYNGFTSGGIFDAERSFEIIIFTILGGIGTILGPVIGTYIMVLSINFYLNDAFVQTFSIPETLPLAILLIVILRFQPRGLANAEPQLRNAMLFGVFWSVTLSFYDAGKFLTSLPNRYHPARLLQYLLGGNETGFLYLDVWSVQGRMVIYFILGSIIGYFTPNILQKLRLITWGVWPNLGKFDPPK